jgi:hypothetical protein
MGCIQWPAQSPGLNLIEAFWLDMETELGETFGRASNVEKLEEYLKVCWNAISEDRMESLIQSMPARL